MQYQKLEESEQQCYDYKVIIFCVVVVVLLIINNGLRCPEKGCENCTGNHTLSLLEIVCQTDRYTKSISTNTEVS